MFGAIPHKFTILEEHGQWKEDGTPETYLDTLLAEKRKLAVKKELNAEEREMLTVIDELVVKEMTK